MFLYFEVTLPKILDLVCKIVMREQLLACKEKERESLHAMLKYMFDISVYAGKVFPKRKHFFGSRGLW